MTEPLRFNWDAPAVTVPISGRTPQSRHASWTGARRAVKTWTVRQSTLLQLLGSGPKTRQDLAVLSGYPISSVCSILDSVRGQIQEVDLEPVTWPDGSVTRRVRWGLR